MTGSLKKDLDLLRFCTAGSVDDGKSTLIGRLLYDSKSVFEDQMQAIERTAKRKQEDQVNLALLTDGLAAEREQGITIDVAYRYFATPKRKFIIADTPGHEQYTRNMVTGASNSDLSLILVDAKQGVLEQTRRHLALAQLLAVEHVVVCVNKMDLVDYSEARFLELSEEIQGIADQLHIKNLKIVPISALKGDMVVERGNRLDWFDGEPLLNFLETVPVQRELKEESFRFPVQLVLRPDSEFRGYAGQIGSGSVKVGDAITVFPSGLSSKVARIVTYDGDLQSAQYPQSVTITLEDEIDISRGDLLALSNEAPAVDSQFNARLCWMSETPMSLGKKYLIKMGAKVTKVMFKEIQGQLDLAHLKELPADKLELNQIARVQVKSLGALPLDDYQTHRHTGCFIVIDEMSNNTVAAGMVSLPQKAS
ncbi:MAG: sulfate adenylyltransferase subunit CysN [Deltaproteobacteria bacterium]|nr:sulfate adenylyltransferase subunit CysN [Deltaproteobacteria bacterium]